MAEEPNPYDLIDAPSPAAIAAVRMHQAVQPVGGRKTPEAANPYNALDPPGHVGLPWEQLMSPESQAVVSGATPEQQAGIHKFMEARGRATEPITAITGSDKTGAVNAAAGGFLEGIPVAGHYIKEGANRAIAHGISAIGGTPYEEVLQGVRDIAQQKEEQHPRAHVAGELAGGVTALAPVAAAAPALLGAESGVPLIQNVRSAAKTGAVLGAAPAALEGKSPGEIAQSAAKGAAAFGAGPLVGKAIGSLAGKLVDRIATSGATGPLAGADSRAVNWALEAMRRDNLISDADVERALGARGPEAFLGEFGPNLRGYLRALGSMSGTGKTSVFEGYGARAQGAGGRIDQAITGVLGPRVNVADLTAEGYAQRSKDAKDLYEKWRGYSIHPTNELKELLPWLERNGALTRARDLAKRDPTGPGDWGENFFTGGPQKKFPTAQSWDYVKRSLDDMIVGSKNQHGEPTNDTRIYTELKSRLMKAIENSSGEGAEAWRQARRAWADPTSLIRARWEGQKAWSPSTRRDDLAGQLADYGAAEREAYTEGARDSLAEMQDRSLRGDTSVRNMLLAPANKGKLEMLAQHRGLPGEGAGLASRMGQEKGYADAMSRVIGNSETAATEFAQKQLSPDPTQTMVARLRHAYLPHVTPEMLIPKTLEDVAAAAQARGYEASRDTMAPWLMKQGPDAVAFAKALMEHGRNIKPSLMLQPDAATMAQVLAQGAAAPIIGARQQQLQGQR